MKNKKILLFCCLFLCAFVIYFHIFDKDENNNVSNSKKDRELEKVENKIDEMLENMSLEEKIGQMLVIDFDNSEMNDEFKDFFLTVKPGGIILMGKNYTTFDETKKLISDIKSLSDIPLIVSTDQEGGRVQRLQYLTDVEPTYIPDMLSLGSMNDASLAKNVGKIMALEMRTLGINIVYAPVLDVFSNPANTVIGNRSFGTNANVVSKISLALANGLGENGVIPTFKHFPGHGDTEIDSHKKLPVISKSYEDVKNLDLVPFKNAIENDAKLIMTAHITFSSIDNVPASFSKKLLTDILRGELGYDGIIITDALNMKALTDNYTNEEIYLKAVDAGVDILLMPVDAKLAIETIKNNVNEERINESVRRILDFKYKYLENYIYTDKSILGSEDHKKIIDKINIID